jgi:hypothetical protein
MTSIERSEALRAIAFCVAQELGKPWTYTEQPAEEAGWQEYIRSADTGMRIYFSLQSSVGYEKHDRVEISGSLNIGKGGEHVTLYEGSSRLNPPSITVARTRGAEAIAKAIKSRFLPEYTRIFGLAVQQVAANRIYDTQVTANLQRLAKASGNVVSTKENEHCREVRTSFTLSIGEVYGTAHASTSTAQLELRCLTMTEAEHILTYLRSAHKNRGEAV